MARTSPAWHGNVMLIPAGTLQSDSTAAPRNTPSSTRGDIAIDKVVVVYRSR
jgi:hypothetical protein